MSRMGKAGTFEQGGEGGRPRGDEQERVRKGVKHSKR
jgi:hypothetical protein